MAVLTQLIVGKNCLSQINNLNAPLILFSPSVIFFALLYVVRSFYRQSSTEIKDTAVLTDFSPIPPRCPSSPALPTCLNLSVARLIDDHACFDQKHVNHTNLQSRKYAGHTLYALNLQNRS